jgi:hypothetical protein
MKKEVKIGIYALLIFLGSWAGIRFLSGADIFGRNNVFYAYYDDASGLQNASSVVIRGVNSIGNPAPALIVCDGMEIGTINAVNINDVLSVEIQRDGTLYGFRGVGGVIVIKTKSGANH